MLATIMSRALLLIVTFRIRIYKTVILPVRNLVPDIKRGLVTEDVCEHDAEVNIWTEEN
jgi:hypothetical protein